MSKVQRTQSGKRHTLSLSKGGLRSRLIELCRANDVTYLAIFGSAARGDLTARSDVDVLIRFLEGCSKTLFDLIGVEDHLRKIFHRKVDLLTVNGLSPHLKNDILSSCKVIYVER